jgi:hypothetical protein
MQMGEAQYRQKIVDLVNQLPNPLLSLNRSNENRSERDDDGQQRKEGSIILLL